MLVFGAGPDMKEYLEHMYMDYNHYFNENDENKKRKCERKLGQQIEAYFRANPVSGHKIIDPDSEYNRILNYSLN